MLSKKNPIPNIKFPISKDGFTLIELLVVLSIFLMLTGLIIANYSGLRSGRNLKIAQNELVSNIRKIQSYSLSSRAVGGTQVVQYYLLRFDTSVPDKYYLDAIYDVSTSPKVLLGIETYNLPQGIKLASTTPSFGAFLIDRPPIQYPSPSSDSADVKSASDLPTNPCVLLAFKLPFASMIFNGGTDQVNSLNKGCRYNTFVGDDYKKIKDYVANSSTNTAVGNSILTINLSTDDGKLGSTVTVNGLTGSVTFSQ
jgi:prepilin-type N-terminal cleavage/methylation domain-containing protein